jgi:hypothetical protein
MKYIAILAVVLSVVSVAISFWALQESRRNAARAIRQRENQLVQHYVPRLRAIAADFAISYPANPQTIDEAIDPLLTLLQSAQRTSDDPASH